MGIEEKVRIPAKGFFPGCGIDGKVSKGGHIIPAGTFSQYQYDGAGKGRCRFLQFQGTGVPGQIALQLGKGPEGTIFPVQMQKTVCRENGSQVIAEKIQEHQGQDDPLFPFQRSAGGPAAACFDAVEQQTESGCQGQKQSCQQGETEKGTEIVAGFPGRGGQNREQGDFIQGRAIMKKIKAIGQTGQFQQEQHQRAEKAKQRLCFPAVGSQFQKNDRGGEKNGRKDEVVSHIPLEKNRKAGKYRTIGQQPEKSEHARRLFFCFSFAGFRQQEPDQEQGAEQEYAAADQAEHRDPVHGVEGDWKTKKKSRKERARISTVLLPAEYRECFRERLGRKEYKRKTSIKM